MNQWESLARCIFPGTAKVDLSQNFKKSKSNLFCGLFQFTVVFIKSMIIVFGVAECGYPWQFSLITSVLMLIFFGLFAQFYIQAYLDKSSAKAKAKTH